MSPIFRFNSAQIRLVTFRNTFFQSLGLCIFLLSSTCHANIIFYEDFEGLVDPPGPTWIANGVDSYFSLSELGNSKLSGAGSIALWFDNSNPNATYNPVGNRPDSANIISTYAAFGGSGGSDAELSSGNIGTTFVDGAKYELTFNFFNRRDLPTGLEFNAEIFNANSGTALATQSFTTVGLGGSGTGTIATGTLIYTASASDNGSGIGVRFVASNLTTFLEQAAFDNIQLFATPEPTSSSLLLLSIGFICSSRRRRN